MKNNVTKTGKAVAWNDKKRNLVTREICYGIWLSWKLKFATNIFRFTLILQTFVASCPRALWKWDRRFILFSFHVCVAYGFNLFRLSCFVASILDTSYPWLGNRRESRLECPNETPGSFKWWTIWCQEKTNLVVFEDTHVFLLCSNYPSLHISHWTVINARHSLHFLRIMYMYLVCNWWTNLRRDYIPRCEKSVLWWI